MSIAVQTPTGPTVEPRWQYFLLALIPFALGIGLFFFFVYFGIVGATADLSQIVVPSTVTLTLHQPGAYTIYLEEQSIVNGQTFSTSLSDVSNLICHISGPPTGEEIPLSRPQFSTTYRLQQRAGRSVLVFEAPRSGRYTLACDYISPSRGPRAVLAVGTGVDKKILSTLLRSFAAIASGGLAGLVIFFVVLAKRDKYRRRIRAGAAQAPLASAIAR
jgi:hypothetical protein